MELGAIILSGGKSKRFGTDKGLFIFKDKPLIQHSIDVCKLFTEDIMILSGNQEYTKFGFRIYEDIFPESGPMGGIHTGLKNSKNDINLVLSSDTPFINEELINLLLDKYNNEDVLIMQTPDGKNQTLIGIYHKRVCQLLDKELSQNHLKMIHFIQQLNHGIIKIPEGSSLEKCFVNFNHLSELKKHEY